MSQELMRYTKTQTEDVVAIGHVRDPPSTHRCLSINTYRSCEQLMNRRKGKVMESNKDPSLPIGQAVNRASEASEASAIVSTHIVTRNI
ncbi:hypothetical protein EVAR_10698_1 [Eumeta japonica]|uniref:Uncharacterized protein n=1 Tax=Eumeta variegata TaxID=151549 RepID=A0A4C1U7D0_EUMVA|nr:hypothetical protein EVAR_10698_1 [Eumeta japonica]